MSAQNGDRQTPSVFSLILLACCFLVLIACTVDQWWLDLPQEMSDVLTFADYIVCLVFLGDFFFRLWNADNKLSFMKWGWIDLVASVPTFGYAKMGRLIRILRVIRLGKTIRSTKQILDFMAKHRAKAAFVSVALLTYFLVILSSLVILYVEGATLTEAEIQELKSKAEKGEIEWVAPENNIQTASDAIWWSVVTVSTVGYGDRYPVSTPGRIVAAILMICGVGLFGTFTGFVSTWFMHGGYEADEDPEKRDIQDIKSRLDDLERMIRTSMQHHKIDFEMSAYQKQDIDYNGPERRKTTRGRRCTDIYTRQKNTTPVEQNPKTVEQTPETPGPENEEKDKEA